MSQDAGSPWRARRLHDIIDSKKNITMDDARDAQYDVFNIPLDNVVKDESSNSELASPETLAVLKDWDGRMTPDSRGSILTTEIRSCLANKMADENKPAPAYLIRETHCRLGPA